jgi:hypothetical protein
MVSLRYGFGATDKKGMVICRPDTHKKKEKYSRTL